MRLLFLLATCFSLNLFFIAVNAQNCKPDYSKLDKIENKNIDAWSCELYESSFGHKLFNSSEIHIAFAIGRMDKSGFVQLQLQKQEESLTNQLTESPFRGAKGDEFYFGMKGGDPLKFIATEVSNETKMNNLLGKYVTTVRLLSEVKNEDLPALKAALTSKTITALRIKLENSNVVEQDVKEKNGKKMMEKAVCYFNSQQQNELPKSEKVTTPEIKNKPQDKENKTVKAPQSQSAKPSPDKNNDTKISKPEVAEAVDYGEQFEGVWTSATKRNTTLKIAKINSSNFEVKQILKAGPLKKNVTPCPTFEFVNNELICKQFKIIYLPEKSSIYYDGNEYKKE